MAKEKILITVTTYPLPSRSYDELVCTAGFREDGSWIRIYPVPLSFLNGLKNAERTTQTKYTWFEMEVERRSDDFRPESYSPKDYSFKDLDIGETINTKGNWKVRKEICLKNVYTNLTKLIEDSKAPQNTSLATFKPTKIVDFIIEKDDDDWKPIWKDLQQQLSLFGGNSQEARKLFPKVPYRFYYRFEDEEGRSSRLMIEDWEIGQLYWKCLKRANHSVENALLKVREKYEADFMNNKDIYFFMGTTKKWHRRRGSNPFVIIGVFYPKKEEPRDESQLALF